MPEIRVYLLISFIIPQITSSHLHVLIIKIANNLSSYLYPCFHVTYKVLSNFQFYWISINLMLIQNMSIYDSPTVPGNWL